MHFQKTLCQGNLEQLLPNNVNLSHLMCTQYLDNSKVHKPIKRWDANSILPKQLCKQFIIWTQLWKKNWDETKNDKKKLLLLNFWLSKWKMTCSSRVWINQYWNGKKHSYLTFLTINITIKGKSFSTLFP